MTPNSQLYVDTGERGIGLLELASVAHVQVKRSNWKSEELQHLLGQQQASKRTDMTVNVEIHLT